MDLRVFLSANAARTVSEIEKKKKEGNKLNNPGKGRRGGQKCLPASPTSHVLGLNIKQPSAF